MASMSNYLETKLLNVSLRGIAYTPPATIYLALFNTDPTEAGSGTEVSGTGYARKPVTFNAPTGGACFNAADVLFNVATGSWGTVGFVGVFDALTGGNLLYHGSIATPKAIETDDQLKISAGDIYISMD